MRQKTTGWGLWHTAAAALLACAATRSAHAQTAVLRGTVSDSAIHAALAGARIEARAGSSSSATFTDARGRFVLVLRAAPAVVVTATRIGYAPRRIVTDLPAPSGGTLDFALAALGVPLDPVVVTASRTAEAALASPVSVSVVKRDAIESHTALTPADNVRAVTGVDMAGKGLIQSTYAVRGERGSISGALLTLTDFRNADVPSLALNVPYLLAVTNEDLDRVEVVRGPGAALYGPGADRGVLHFITRSPFESEGGTLTLTGGGRSLFEGTVRYAARLGRTLAVKISADYLSGHDWPFTDSTEVSNRAAALAAGASPDTLRIGRRDPNVARAGGEVRVDWRPAASTELVTLAGTAQAIHVVELGGDIGSVQARGWRYTYFQTRLTRERWLANAFLNLSNTEDSYALLTGDRIVDSSRVAVVQLQHGSLLGPADLLYGADARWTDPRTGGTVDGANEDHDRMAEIGAYVHATVPVGPRVELVAALRADHHSRLDDVALSPRVAVVFRPSSEHALRLTFNRAFTSPDANTLFIDKSQGDLPGLPYSLRVRASSVPQGGYTFARDCGGQLCMYSPLGDPAAPLAADATLLWDSLIAVLRRQGVMDLSGIPRPTAAQVATNLARFDGKSSFDPVAPAAVGDIPALRRTVTDVVELGWKAMIRQRYGMSVDLFVSHVNDPIGSRYGLTPNVFLDGPMLAAYLSGFMPAAQAAQAAGAIAQLPLATVSPQQTTHPGEMLVISRQGGAYTLWGLDAELDLAISHTVAARGTFSWLSRNRVASAVTPDTTVLGVPRNKASLGLLWRDAQEERSAGIDGRWVEGFSVNSGWYTPGHGYGDSRVEGYAVADAHVAFRLPGLRRTSALFEISNVFDHRHQEFVGAPALGRLLLARARTEF